MTWKPYALFATWEPQAMEASDRTESAGHRDMDDTEGRKDGRGGHRKPFSRTKPDRAKWFSQTTQNGEASGRVRDTADSSRTQTIFTHREWVFFEF